MKCCSRIKILVPVALAALLLVGCKGKTVPNPTPTVSERDLVTIGPLTGTGIKALGVLRPAQNKTLGFTSGGELHSVTAQVGAEVRAGDVLAELDTTALEFELEKARESVALRHFELDELLDGPDPVPVERAESEHAREVATAENALEVVRLQVAEAHLQEQAEKTAHQQEVALAEAKLEGLALQVAQAREQSPAAELTGAQIDLARAQDALETAHVEYDKAIHRHWEPQEVHDAYAKALWLAEGDLALAQARFEGALAAQRAHELGLAALTTQRDAAAIELTRTLESQAAFTTTLALLEVGVTQAQTQLDGLLAWQNPYLDPPSPRDIAQRQSALRQAELVVEELEWRLGEARLRAPFGGVVSAVHLDSGEWTGAGVPVLELLDVSRWLVETKNVGELQIGRVRVGQEAQVRVNAFPGETLHGRVATISPVAVVQQGDTTYTLTIELDSTALNLRPGMTVQVEILSGDG